MKKPALVFVTLWLTQICIAQTNYVKLGIDYGPVRSYRYITPEEPRGLVFKQNFEIEPQFSFGLVHMKTRDKFWEIGFSGRFNGASQQFPGYKITDADGNTVIQSIGTVTSTNVALSVERGRNLKPGCAGSRDVYGAWFLSPFYQGLSFRDDFKEDELFGQKIQSGGLVFGASPRLYSFVGKKALVELSMRLNILSMSYLHQQIANPALSDRQQQTDTFEMDALSGMSVRLSIGLRAGGAGGE